MNSIRETVQDIPDIVKIVQQIGTLREYCQRILQQGKLPPQDVLDAMADSIEATTERLTEEFVVKWKTYYTDVKASNLAPDFCESVMQWENEIFDYLNRLPLCNICKVRAPYAPKTDYYRRKQRENGFPYWNAVMESISYQNCTCPKCQSMDRERMISLFLDMLSPAEGKRLKVLQIAPSHALDYFLKTKENIDYDTTDLMMPGVTFQSDIQNMNTVQDQTYDIIICSHILEHVENDTKAMAELRRILKDDGVCIFLIPLIIGLDKTDESFGLSAEENWKRFGQDDHARLYAKEDFLNRLTQAGFLVHILGKSYFGEELWQQNGLSDIHLLYAATKQDIGLGISPYQIKEKKEELVSVVIPTYNRGYCIERAVRSVLQQTYQNLEVIVVDDGSTDNTSSVIERIKDSRLSYIRVKGNKGANHARNVGIEASKGAYIAFNDSDDEWLPEKLEKQMNLMLLEDDGQLGCVYCILTRYQDGKAISTAPNMEIQGENVIGDIYHYMQLNMFISTQTLLLKKSILDDVGYFNEDLKRLQDWELLLRIAQKYKFTLVQESLVNVYEQEDSISKNAKGFVDTVRYVVNLHQYYRNNREAYRILMTACVNCMAESDLDRDYKESILAQIENDGILPAEWIAGAKNRLGIDHTKDEASDSSESMQASHNIQNEINWLKNRVEHISLTVEENNRAIKELIWAQVFNSSKSAFSWLPENLALWPGRWGVGYQYMYVVSRYLNEVRPKSILETGLGQSTRLICSYVKWMNEQENCNHIVIEHDQNWIDIFKNDVELSSHTCIVQRDLAIMQTEHPSNGVKCSDHIYKYKDLDEVLKGKKFDFISLDGPYGTDEQYGFSRIDILEFLPGCLNKSFCIIVDDYNRYGEKNTMEVVKDILKQHQINFVETVYSGEQDMYLLASADLKYLCTL